MRVSQVSPCSQTKIRSLFLRAPQCYSGFNLRAARLVQLVSFALENFIIRRDHRREFNRIIVSLKRLIDSRCVSLFVALKRTIASETGNENERGLFLTEQRGRAKLYQGKLY